MLLTITDTPSSAIRIADILARLGLFSLYSDYNEAVTSALRFRVNSIIIFTDGETRSASKICRVLKKRVHGLRVLALVNRLPDSPSLFLDVSHSDCQLLFPYTDTELTAELARFCRVSPGGGLTSYSLFTGADRNSSLYLGCPLRLSPTDFRILRLTALNSPIPVNFEFYSRFCFETGVTPNCLAVHVC